MREELADQRHNEFCKRDIGKTTKYLPYHEAKVSVLDSRLKSIQLVNEMFLLQL